MVLTSSARWRHMHAEDDVIDVLSAAAEEEDSVQVGNINMMNADVRAREREGGEKGGEEGRDEATQDGWMEVLSKLVLMIGI